MLDASIRYYRKHGSKSISRPGYVFLVCNLPFILFQHFLKCYNNPNTIIKYLYLITIYVGLQPYLESENVIRIIDT